MLYYKWDSIEHENATAISAKQWIEINFSLTFFLILFQILLYFQ